jgi:hypothetical protein
MLMLFACKSLATSCSAFFAASLRRGCVDTSRSLSSKPALLNNSVFEALLDAAFGLMS